jgi:hypothetical protein
MTKKQVGEESRFIQLILPHCCSSPKKKKKKKKKKSGLELTHSHRAGTWRQELMQRPWRGAAY